MRTPGELKSSTLGQSDDFSENSKTYLY